MARLAALACALLAASTAHAAIAPTPPVIHERFTPLPCPMHPTTTVALEGCAEQAILAGDRRINAQVRAIFVILPAAARAGFAKSEQAWLRYRNASCVATASVYAGGTVRPVAYGWCVEDRNRTHLVDLRDLRNALRTH